MKKITLLLLLYCLTYMSWGQQKNHFLIGVEVGSTSIIGERSDNWQIRQTAAPNADRLIETEAYGSITYFGIKPEYRFLGNKMSIASGIRYVNITADIEPSTSYYSYNTMGQEYLFLRYQTNGSSMYFAKVKQIKEKKSYISVPIEWQYIPFRIGNFGFYGKVGAELGVKIYDNTQIAFLSKEMQQEEKNILDMISPKTNPIYANSYMGVGCKMTIRKLIEIGLELNAPLAHTKSNTSILDEKFVGNIQLSVQIPLTNWEEESDNEIK